MASTMHENSIRWGKSFADDLVRTRVLCAVGWALLLRTVEIRLLFSRFV